MTDLERLTAAFEAMNPWARELLRDLAEGYAIDFPAPTPAPDLQLDTENRHEVPHERT
jgi:hypothetical protein